MQGILGKSHCHVNLRKLSSTPSQICAHRILLAGAIVDEGPAGTILEVRLVAGGLTVINMAIRSGINQVVPPMGDLFT